MGKRNFKEKAVSEGSDQKAAQDVFANGKLRTYGTIRAGAVMVCFKEKESGTEKHRQRDGKSDPCKNMTAFFHNCDTSFCR